MAIRVMIVDDHALVRQALRVMLDLQPEIAVIAEAADGKDTLNKIAQVAIDVILLDLIMPGMGGIEVIERLRQTHPALKILVLTSSLDDEIVRQALQVGAHGYILKASTADVLVKAIEGINVNQYIIDPAIAARLLQSDKINHPLHALTEREREVFDNLAHGLTNAEIALALHIAETTVRTHVISVLDKLNLRDRAHVMVFALKHGLVNLDDLPS